jgi:hypothetical protein
MIWSAYAGLAGTVVASLVLLAWIVGVPQEALVRIAVQGSAAFMAVGMLVHLTAIAVRRRGSRSH